MLSNYRAAAPSNRVGRRSTPFSVDWNAYLDIGTILGKKRYPEATAALQRAVELDLNQPDAHYWLGRVYQSANDEAAAKREFAKVRALHQKAEDDVASQMFRLSKTKPQ